MIQTLLDSPRFGPVLFEAQPLPLYLTSTKTKQNKKEKKEKTYVYTILEPDQNRFRPQSLNHSLDNQLRPDHLYTHI